MPTSLDTEPQHMSAAGKAAYWTRRAEIEAGDAPVMERQETPPSDEEARTLTRWIANSTVLDFAQMEPHIRAVLAAAYREGAEEMRERAAKECHDTANRYRLAAKRLDKCDQRMRYFASAAGGSQCAECVRALKA